MYLYIVIFALLLLIAYLVFELNKSKNISVGLWIHFLMSQHIHASKGYNEYEARAQVVKKFSKYHAPLEKELKRTRLDPPPKLKEVYDYIMSLKK
jgi:hypothetical protein